MKRPEQPPRNLHAKRGRCTIDGKCVYERMSLGQQLAPHLPFLRRFGRSLTGNQSYGDAYVRQTLEAIVTSPENFPRDVDPRLALYRMFMEALKADELSDEENLSEGGPKAVKTLIKRRDPALQALLLTASEGFSAEDAGYLIGRSESEVNDLVVHAMDELHRNAKPSRIMIIEDEPIIALDLGGIVDELGHIVSGVFSDGNEAIAHANQNNIDLILADIQIRGGLSGIDIANRILADKEIPLIFVTAYPERLLTGDRPEPTFLITKPYQRSTVRSAITQAILFDKFNGSEGGVDDLQRLASVDAVHVEEEFDTTPPTIAQDAIEDLAKSDLNPKPAPITTKLVGATLSRSSQPPVVSKIPILPLERLRLEHLATADRLCASTQADNLGLAFTMRLLAVRTALSEPIDEASGLTLGVQAQGLRRMLPAVHEQLSVITATDIDVFINDIFQISTQFPDYQQFTSDAATNGRHTPAQKAALVKASRFFEEQPDDLVAPQIKADLAAVRVNAEELPDEVADLAFERVIGNIIKSYGEFLVARLRGVNGQIWLSFDKAGGGTIGVILALLLVGIPVFFLLQAAFPGSFAFLLSMMKTIKAIIP